MPEGIADILLKFISAIVAPLIGWIFWLYRGQLKKLDDQRVKIDTLQDRVVTIESSLSHVPATEAIHELSLMMERLSGDMRTLDARLESTDAALSKLDKIVNRQESYLLNRGSVSK